MRQSVEAMAAELDPAAGSELVWESVVAQEEESAVTRPRR